MNFQESHNLKDFSELYQENPERVIFFVGAGLSMPLFPSWSTFLKELVERTDAKGKLNFDKTELLVKIDNGLSFLEIADHCADAIGKNEYREIIEKNFDKEFDIEDIPFKDKPSEKARLEITKLIKEKEIVENSNDKNLLFKGLNFNHSYIVPTPYEKRNLETLKENLEQLDKTYEDDDEYFIYEESANKFNFKIFNHSEKYIEDASIELKIDKKNIFVCNKIISKPVKYNHFLDLHSSPTNSFSY
ncbi:hypothetical protein [Patiriisocius marinus]|uniref:hypothetical protein n=1 Tax=Patiriisocius marinus TaxID=1397112 RepID=UPI00232E67C8|nr:hypothetical protein [Patiriisocius marinus]